MMGNRHWYGWWWQPRAMLCWCALSCACSASPAKRSDAGPQAHADAGGTSVESDAALQPSAADSAASSTGSGHDLDAHVTSADAAAAGSDSGVAPGDSRMLACVNVHAYPKPTAYGFTAADGKDRMGEALQALGVTCVRGPTLGDTAFLARLASFGVKQAILGLSASAHGKPFDPKTVAPALQKSLDMAKTLGLVVQVEGLNEWDLFNGKSYNAGVIPSGMSVSEFVLFTQKALYEAAHPLGLQVIGPSVGHPSDATHLAMFPDVSAYVDIVNAHIYYTASPEKLPLAKLVSDHEHFQGTHKPLWVTETGWSSYGSVTPDMQADIIHRGLTTFAASGAIARAYNYELLDGQKPGLSGTTYTPDSAEYHFGLFTFEGALKPAGTVMQDYIAGKGP